MDQITESLATLQSRLVDAAEGHAKGMKLTDDPTLRRVFEELHGIHRTHAGALALSLSARGATPQEDGSFLQYVHKAVLTVRSVVGGLDEDAIPGVRDGEERLLKLYDESLREAGGDAGLVALLEVQRDEVAAAVQRLRGLEAAAR